MAEPLTVSPAPALLMSGDKITASHLGRDAYVYVFSELRKFDVQLVFGTVMLRPATLEKSGMPRRTVASRVVRSSI
jgi:hypothetical protein